MKRLYGIYLDGGGYRDVTVQAIFIRTRGTVLSEIELRETKRRVLGNTRQDEQETMDSIHGS